MSVAAFERVVREELQHSLASVEQGLLAGVGTMEEYRQLVGERRGLNKALAIVEDTLKKFDAQ